jgi:arabinofuranosyltransferase
MHARVPVCTVDATEANVATKARRLELQREWPVVLLLVPYIWLVNRFWFLCDDAYITFRYSKNLARGSGVRFNLEGDPVEGYSNFLWMLVAALFEADLQPIETIMPVLSVTTGALLVGLLWWVLRARAGLDRLPAFAATAALALCPSFDVWATSGLATMPFAFLVFLFWERSTFAEGRWSWVSVGLAGLALATIRTEGIAWVGVIAVLAAAARWTDAKRPTLQRTLAPVVLGLVFIGTMFAIYTSWRVAHFGEWLPNTAHAKVGFTMDRLMRGIKYVGLFGLTFPMMAIWLAGTWRALGWRVGAGTSVFLLAVGFPAYGVAVGGDFFPMGRMLLPGLAFGAALFGWTVQALWERRGAERALAPALVVVVVVVGVIPAFNVHVVPHSAREALHFRLSDKSFMTEYERWENLRDNLAGFSRRGHALRILAHHDDAVVTQAIGVIGYYTDLQLYDQYGLVDREVAKLPSPSGPLLHSPGHDKFVEPGFFAKYEPEILASRTVQGPLASRLMKDTLDRWVIPEPLRSTYVPDFVEVELPGYEGVRSFLLMVRRVREGERARRMWSEFPERRKSLLASFETADGSETVAEDGSS